MKEIITKHIDACMTELRAAIEKMFRDAIDTLAPGLERPATRGSPRRRADEAPPESRARLAKPAKRGSTHPAKAARTGTARAGRPCGCGPVGRHRRECKLKAPKPGRKAASDSEEQGADVPAPNAREQNVAPARDESDLRAAARQVRAARELVPEVLPVIPRGQLIARLAADRDVTGDAGGLVATALRPAGPSLVGHVDSLERRETCPVHGWVGRRRFVEDGHAQCAALPEGAEPCHSCKGRGFAQSLPCKRCKGTRIDPGDRAHRDIKPSNQIQDNAPHDAAEGAGA